MTIPSINTTFLQYPTIYFETDVPIGSRLVILGTGETGTSYHPMAANSSKMMLSLFGEGSIASAYQTLIQVTASVPVYGMKVEYEDYASAFQVLESFEFDLLFLPDVDLLEEVEIRNSFLAFAKNKEEKGQLVHAISSLRSTTTYEQVLAKKELIASFSQEIGDDWVEQGKYFSLVFPQSEENSGAYYAGLLLSLTPNQSPVNKSLPLSTLTKHFTANELRTLRELGIVCMKETYKKGITFATAGCAVQTPGSVHQSIANFRIVQYILNQLSPRLQTFIGKPYVPYQREVIEEQVEWLLLLSKEKGMLRAYDYEVMVYPVEGIITVALSLVPIFSVQAITTHTQVRVYR